MTVKNSLLAILAQEPAHGYGLKSAFEESTAGAWPLNVGQVYTTLARLERDGLVETGPSRSSSEGERERQTWNLTVEGRSTLEGWYRKPVLDDPPARDELAIKVLLAVAADQVDVAEILQIQRAASMQRLQELTQHKRRADPEAELPWLLLLDALILKVKAELEWIELCEARLRGRRP